MRLIDADALKERILEERDKIPKTIVERYSFGVPTPNKHGNLMRGGIRIALRCMEQTPTIEAEPVRWLPIKGYEGLYEVNEYGLIRNTKGQMMRQRLKKAKYTDYKKVSLWKDGKYKHLYVSRIVAEAFIPNPDNLPLVNHKDEDGTNNWVGNLEWCNRSYNATYGSSPKKKSKAFKGRESEKRKAVLSFDMGGTLIEKYSSVTEAAKAVNGTTTNISAACKGKKKTAYGRVWSYDCPNCGAKNGR